jgi:hypothetical protein
MGALLDSPARDKMQAHTLRLKCALATMFGINRDGSTRAKIKVVVEMHRAEVTLTPTANSKAESEGYLNEKEEKSAAT